MYKKFLRTLLVAATMFSAVATTNARNKYLLFILQAMLLSKSRYRMP